MRWGLIVTPGFELPHAMVSGRSISCHHSLSSSRMPLPLYIYSEQSTFRCPSEFRRCSLGLACGRSGSASSKKRGAYASLALSFRSRRATVLDEYRSWVSSSCGCLKGWMIQSRRTKGWQIFSTVALSSKESLKVGCLRSPSDDQASAGIGGVLCLRVSRNMIQNGCF